MLLVQPNKLKQGMSGNHKAFLKDKFFKFLVLWEIVKYRLTQLNKFSYTQLKR